MSAEPPNDTGVSSQMGSIPILVQPLILKIERLNGEQSLTASWKRTENMSSPFLQVPPGIQRC